MNGGSDEPDAHRKDIQKPLREMIKKSARKLHSRQSDNDIPIGWLPVGEDDGGRMQYRCNKMMKCITDQSPTGYEIRRCTIKKRRYEIAGHVRSKRHRFDLPASEDPDNHFNDRHDQEKRQEIYTAKALNLLARMISTLGMSVSKGSSLAMHEFQKKMFQLGMQFQSNIGKDEACDPGDVIVRYSDKMISQVVHVIADQTREELLGRYRQIRLVNVKVDAGTVLRSHIVHTIIDARTWTGGKTPFYREKLQRYIWDVKTAMNWTTEDYAQHFVEVFSFCDANRLTISSVSHDNLPAQVAGLKAAARQFGGTMLLVPCYCHLMNLVFTNTARDCAVLSQFVTAATSWQTVLRSSDARKFLGFKLKTVPQTRWLYLFEVLLDIKRGIQRIDKFIVATGQDVESIRFLDDAELHQFPRSILEFASILAPLRHFTDRMERSQASLCDAIDEAEQMLASMQAYMTSLRVNRHLSEATKTHLEEVVKQLLVHFLVRFTTNAFDEACTAAALTMKCRERLRVRQSGNLTQGPPHLATERGTADLTCSLERSLELVDERDPRRMAGVQFTAMTTRCGDEGKNGVVQQLVSALNHPERPEPERDGGPLGNTGIAQNASDRDELDLRDGDRDTESEASPVTDAPGIGEMSLDDLLRFDFLKEIEKRAGKTLAEYGMRVYGDDEGDRNVRDHLRAQFDSWLYATIDQLPFSCTLLSQENNPYWVWSKAKLEEDWEQFGEIARRFVTAAVSEADVERLLSRQRNIQGDRTTRVSNETLQDVLFMSEPMPQ